MLSIILLWLFPLITPFMFKYQITRGDGLFLFCVYLNVHFDINNSLLYIYNQNNFEDPFYQSEDKGLFHVFFPHDCHLHLYGSCIFMYMNPSAKDRVSLSKRVTVLNTSVALMLNPFIDTLRNLQVKRSFMDMARKTLLFSRKWKNKSPALLIRGITKSNQIKIRAFQNALLFT